MSDALESRLANTPVGERYSVLTGDCNDRIEEVVALIPEKALTLAFIDPKGLDAKFPTIATLSKSRRVDLVILFADAYDISRNVEQHYRQNRDSKLDQTLGPECPWRELLDGLTNPTGPNKRNLFRKAYEDQLRRHLGYTHFRHKPIKSERGPIYSLVYASKHERGLDFWDKALSKNVDGQLEMF